MSIRLCARSWKYENSQLAGFLISWLENRETVYIEISCKWLKRIEDEPDVMGRVITGDESWIRHFDPETILESVHWKSPQSLEKKKVHRVKLMNKVMLILFFNMRAVYRYFVPRHMTINTLYYCKVLRTLNKHVNKKKPDLKKICPCTTTVVFKLFCIMTHF